MQPVNVLPVFVSQDADLKTKESSGSSADSNKDTDFSSLVEQHLPEEKKSKARKETATSGHDNPATQSKSIADNGKSDLDKVDSRQESDTKQSLDADDSSAETPVDEIWPKENETEKSDSAKKGSLTESEQFISLLYNSDKTLAQTGEKTDSPNKQSSAITSESQDVEIKVIDTNSKGQDGKGAAVTVVTAQESSTLPGDHKLKAFSKEQLLARAQLKNNNVLTTQSSDQALKAYQLSLQSQQGTTKSQSITSEQLMNAQLASARLNNKVTDLAAGISQASKSQLTEQVDSGLYQLPVEPIGEGDTFTDDMPISDKAVVVKESGKQSDNKTTTLAKAKGGESAELAIDLNDDTDPKLTKKENIPLAPINVKASNIDAGQSQSSKGNLDKLIAEQTAQGPGAFENISKEQVVDTQIKQPAMTNAQLQALQQIQAQQKAESVSGEQQASEDAGEEYIEPLLSTQEKFIDQGVKAPNKAIDNITLRSVSDLQAQTVQTTQAKQSNDAYIDHQLSEVLNHNVASDTAQIQKNNTLLQQETLSIFRKDFADAVKDKVMVTINQKLQQFDITLDPPEFGNMQVRVNLQGEQASVNFVVQNQQAKDALEQNMHKLRDMLSEQGVDVGDANVEQQNQQNNQDENNLKQHNRNNDNLANGIEKGEDNVEHLLSAKLFDSSATGVDYYA